VCVCVYYSMCVCLLLQRTLLQVPSRCPIQGWCALRSASPQPCNAESSLDPPGPYWFGCLSL